MLTRTSPFAIAICIRTRSKPSRVIVRLKVEAFKQPYHVEAHERQSQGRLTVRFEFQSDIEVSGAHLAMEDAESILVRFDGNEVQSTADGCWVDEAIKTIKLQTFSQGGHFMELEYSFGILTNIERVYILGRFGVQLSGKSITITSLDLGKVTWGDYTRQGLSFYVGNVFYSCKVTIPQTTADSNSLVTTILETP